MATGTQHSLSFAAALQEGIAPLEEQGTVIILRGVKLKLRPRALDRHDGWCPRSHLLARLRNGRDAAPNFERISLVERPLSEILDKAVTVWIGSVATKPKITKTNFSDLPVPDLQVSFRPVSDLRAMEASIALA